MNYDNVKLAYVILKTYDQVQKESDNKMAKFFYKMTNLKLQKISYFVYGLDFNNETLSPEFKKWKFGPVMEDVYYQVRSIDAGGFNISFEKYRDYVKTNFSNTYMEIEKFANAKSSIYGGVRIKNSYRLYMIEDFYLSNLKSSILNILIFE
jgi:uncharacterized phage-associated protein